MLNNRNYLRWGLIAFFIYNLMVLTGTTIHIVGHNLLIDADLTSIIANIFTTTHGFFAGLFGYGDIFKYSRLYLLPYILGSLIWVILGFFLYHIALTKSTPYSKATYLSKFLGFSGVITFIISTLITMLYYVYTSDPFSIILLIFLAVIYVPLLLVGLVFKLVATFFYNKK